MRKAIQLIIVGVIILLMCSITFAESEEVTVTIPEFDVAVNGQLIDTEHSQYPVISYKGVTYFPMTTDYLSGIGLSLSFSSVEGLKINAKDDVGSLEQSFLGASNILGSQHKAKLVPFKIEVNGKIIINSEEEYPVLLYKDITYFPMTWRFAVDEFGWKTRWSDDLGFGIEIVEETVESEITESETSGDSFEKRTPEETMEYYADLKNSNNVTSLSMSNSSDDYLNLTVSNNMLHFEGMTYLNKKCYLYIYVKNDNGEDESKKVTDNEGKFSFTVPIRNIKNNDKYRVDIAIFPEEYGKGVYWVYNDVYLKKDNGVISFDVSLVHYMNQDKFEPTFYEEGTYLSSTRGVQSEDEKIIALSQEIVKGATSDYDKALKIHDWVADNIYYNRDAVSAGNDYGDNSAIGVLKSKLAVCQGYAQLAAALYRASDIPCKVVSGYALGVSTGGVWDTNKIKNEDTNHAWNEVYIDGRWIIIDITWDSGKKFENGEFINESLRNRKYFDPTIEWFSLNHRIVNN